MDVLWAHDEPMTVRAVHERLADRDLAYTTVMTVLTRLAGKKVVRRERAGRAWRYAPAASREDYVAELMLEALALTGDRGSALVRFAHSVSSDEAAALRAALVEPPTGTAPTVDPVPDPRADGPGGSAGEPGTEPGRS
ncbi:Predicted transcriptional regulator [Amycolatopsis arida]|uniref:Predicted transcriptional regulator n=2 Tax=Amycolatopsis arida TaxID=587909 RepID=A0A1I5SMC2_9PSEU|nr:Predicted transcriptional regulator [Amycolatopsis arida]